MTEKNIATQRFIEYLKIKTVHPEPDYASAIKFIKAYAEEVGFDSYKEIEVSPGRTVCLMSYYGKSREKPAILLNSHTDVVPVFPAHWKCDAFEGKQYENGDIYGRGTQDMKSVGIQHMELMRKMISSKVRPERTIHLTFVPDEEIGGTTGFSPLIATKEFKDLNIGVALDEGMASVNDVYNVYYGERVAWRVALTCGGNAGHGSRFIEKTAAEKLQRLLNIILAYRETENQRLKDSCSCLKLGDVTTVNLTMLSGGVARNVVPSEFTAVFDMRISPTIKLEDFDKKLMGWIKEAEGDDADSGKIEYSFFEKPSEFALSSTDEDKNPYWKTFSTSIRELGIETSTEVFPAGTDSRFLREIGIPAFGFSPIINTPILLHDHNEFLNENIFLAGIDTLYKVVLDLANMQ